MTKLGWLVCLVIGVLAFNDTGIAWFLAVAGAGAVGLLFA